MQHTHTTTTEKQKAALSTKKAQGTLQKVLELIEQDAYCPEVIQQIDAAIGLLKSTKQELLRGHLHHCLMERLQQDETKTVNELLKIYQLGQK